MISFQGKTRFSVLATAMCAAALMIVFLWSGIVHAQAKTFNLKYAGFMPATDRHERTMVWYAQELEKRTNGRVKITLFHSQSLGALFDYPKLLKGGVCDIAPLATALPDFPLLGSFFAPYVMPSDAKTAEAFWAIYNKGLLKELDEYKPLWYSPNDPFYFQFRNKKVTKMEDLKGLKVRSNPGFGVGFINALGATGIAMPAPEVYTALERGTLDGLSTTPGFITSVKLNEVLKYWLWEPVSTGGNVIAMTKKTWNSFPPDIQAIMDKLGGEAAAKFIELNKPADKDAMRKLGFDVYDLSKEEHARWKKVAQQLIDKWIAENEAKGLPARQVIELADKIAD
jgi:TRAP-type transport system periplasmic protein